MSASILYIHGFASSPASRKAQYLRERFAAFGVEMQIPAMDEGDFFRLTLSRQRQLIERITEQRRPSVIIGSSMGGYLSTLYASENHVEAAILLAPAVDFAVRWRERLGEAQLAQWERDGQMNVFHHALQRETPLSYDLMRDAPNHEHWPQVTAPTLVLHGMRDDVVPQTKVEQWVSQNKTARLRLFDAGHELTEVLPEIFEEMRGFLLGLGLL